MAYEKVTVQQFLDRYPQFEYQDAMIALVLVEAETQVDDSWVSQADYTRGIMLWTAHTLTQSAADAASGGLDTGAEIASESFGPISVSYVKKEAGNNSTDYGQFGTTSYGQQFYVLRSQNVGGPVVIT